MNTGAQSMTTLELTGGQIIGRSVSQEGSEYFRAKTASSNKELEPPYFYATSDEINLAVEKAHAACPALRQIHPNQRADFLDAIANEIEALGSALIDRCSLETALPEARLIGERGRTCGQLRMFANLVRGGSWVDARIDTAIPDREPVPKPDVRRVLRPIGPVVVFGASNFPLAFSTAGGDTASAFAAGNPVIVKGHQAHPGTTELVGWAIQKAVEKTNMPEGTFSLIQGGIEQGKALVTHPLVSAVAFTGSLRGGRAIYDLASTRSVPIPVFAEMGSINPLFLLDGALKAKGSALAKSLASSITVGTGQFCTNPGLIIGIGGEPFTTFQESLIENLQSHEPARMLTSDILSAYKSGLGRLENSAEIIARQEPNGKDQAGFALFACDAKEFIQNPELQEENFGPSSLIVTCQDQAEMKLVIDALQGQLTATIHAADEDAQLAQELASHVEPKVGRVLFNGYPTGVEVCPSMHHGGPYPATSDSRFTSVGTAAIARFARPVCYQDAPESVLPLELQNSNPLKITRLVNGELNREAI